MLVLKKMSTKKLMIYAAIIVLLLAATGLMLYQNKKLTSLRAAPSGGLTQPVEVASPAAAKAKNNGGLDLTIFSSEKFKELRNNISVSQERPETGKRNPFQPE